MKTGIELIADERQQQIEKHGRTVEKDVETNSKFELTEAASALIIPNNKRFLDADALRPCNWNRVVWNKMYNKPYKERLIIAGALIAAELDRLQAEG